MPASLDDNNPDTRLAVIAESLYLANLLILPGFAFLILLWLYRRQRRTCSAVSLTHLKQSISASLWAGILLVACNLLILMVGGYDGPWIWMIVIVYFTTAHSTLIILGMIGLIKALAGESWRYPLIGGLLK